MPEITPLSPNPSVLAFLRGRRSRPAKTLTTPVPDEAGVRDLLEIAARTPDHGKLEPWRFVVLTRPACIRLAAEAEARAAARGLEPELIAKARAQFETAHLVVTVVASPKDSVKIPQIEQTLSAGAVCQQLLCAALASGWGANWLTTWLSTDAPFLAKALDLAPQEWVAGFIHIGTEGALPPERPRPDLAQITTWLRA